MKKTDDDEDFDNSHLPCWFFLVLVFRLHFWFNFLSFYAEIGNLVV